jgi:two-component sensor histidine kinase
MAPRKKYIGIGRRMAVFTVIVGIAVMTVIALVRGVATIRQIDHLFRLNLEGQADAYTSAIEAALWVHDMEVLGALVDGMGNSRLVARATVMEEGAVLHEAVSGPDSARLIVKRELSHELLDQDHVIGSLVIHADDREFRNEILSWLAVELPLDLAGVLLIGGVLYGYVKRRLADRLRTDADAIATFDLRNDPPLYRGAGRPDDEISELEHGFDRMSDALRGNFRELDEAHRNLTTKLDERTLLIRELFHRTRNNMQIILSFMSLESSHIDDDRLRQPFRSLETRIHAMALVHQMLADGEDLNVIELGPYLTQLSMLVAAAEDFALRNIAVLVHAPATAEAGLEEAIPLGLALTELLTNMTRQCLPCSPGIGCEPEFRVTVDGTACDGEQRSIIISLQALGNPKGATEPLHPLPRLAAINLDLVEALVEGQLNGNFSVLNESDGSLVFRMEYVA